MEVKFVGIIVQVNEVIPHCVGISKEIVYSSYSPGDNYQVITRYMQWTGCKKFYIVNNVQCHKFYTEF